MTVDNDQFYSVDVDFDVNSTTRGSIKSNKNRKLKNPAGRKNHHRNKKKIAPTSTTTTTTTNYNNNNSSNKSSSSYNNNIIKGNCSNRLSRSVRFSSDGSSIGVSGNSSINSNGWSNNFGNKDCYNDDVSSLHFDEYGYDAKSRYGDDDDNDDNDSVSQFFNAPTRRELSTALFKLVEPNGSTSDALSSLSKLRMWGLVADTDEVTTKLLLEYQAVPTLLYFVRDIIEKRRILSMKVKNNSASSNSNNNNNKQIQIQMQLYIDEANNNELCLHQAMQVIYHCTCFRDGDSGKNKNQNNSNKATISVVANANNCANTTTSSATITNATGIDGGGNGGSSSLSAKHNVITQLVETDGIELLVTILEEQLRILAQANGSKNAFSSLLKGCKSPPKATKEQFDTSINNSNSTIGQYSHSVSKSVWLILMNVGTCDNAIKLLKTTSQKKYSHQLKRFVMGIVIGLNYRFYVSGLGDGGGGGSSGGAVNQHHIMPITQNSSRDTDGNHGGDASSWMEDLFITLCRLVGSKHADSVDNNERNEKKGNIQKETTKQNNNNNIIQPDDHDEIRSLLIEKWIVKKCLKLLLDEKNNVLGKDSFITTLAMSFFYACIQFSVRYKKLNNPKNCIIAKKKHNNNNENVENEGEYNGNSDDNDNNIDMNAEKTVSRSLDYDRLIHFTLKSMKSFPSHQLVQATGCLILESIPKPYKLLWMNTNRGRTMMVSTTAKSSISTDSTSSLSFTPHQKTIASAFVKEVLEPCSWYCVDT
ncbi:hypothetical protein FRACYDRAFT_233310 [Fragilariopsis cylindrus CCMP1102]|uniref:Uncharacterized protein n=1 Tax=Fragilariopsis cylindrus CCMP1102 TaxID=635003 RepID=A0A1E7FYB1_9STRA|nr:hypothetical protein FRACYDRAFT_233310 [Fragilariopsis cylindrus CCMP1102]|eukprot:OEU23142.1 hypothetical protein FRACYDRAFT_233310 [Fragilariopsis cylindrus CCMP1102]